jgi:hypothetical protein
LFFWAAGELSNGWHSTVIRAIPRSTRSIGLSAFPSRRCEPLAGEPCGIVGGKENGDAGDVIRLSDATKRRECDHRLLEVTPYDATLFSAIGRLYPSASC